MTELATASDGTAIAWDRSGEGPPVVLVHGIGSSRRRWEAQVRALVDAGYSTYRLDLRGFGESGGKDAKCAMPEFLGDLSSFVAATGVERFHLVGHSLGGMIAQRYAVEHPERLLSLTLASTTSHNGRRATAFARVMVLYSERGFDAVMEDPAAKAEVMGVLAEAFSGIEPPLAMLRTGLVDPNPPRANAWRACIDFTAKDEIGKLTCPVLVMHGTADPMIPFRAGELVKAAIPHAEWLEESGAGHSLPSERAESFSRALLDFLGRTTPASRRESPPV